MTKQQIKIATTKQLEKLPTRLLVTICRSKYLGNASDRAKQVLQKRNVKVC